MRARSACIGRSSASSASSLQKLAVADDRVQRRADLVAHARQELRLRRSGAVRERHGAPKLVGHGPSALDLDLEIDAGVEDAGVIDRHGRDIGERRERGDPAQPQHGGVGHVVRRRVQPGIHPEKNRHGDGRDPEQPGLQPTLAADVEQRQDGDDQHPGQGGRGHPAVMIAAPQDGEVQIDHRQHHQPVIGHAPPQKERKDPEQADADREDQHVDPRGRVEGEERDRNAVSQHRADRVADQEHPRLVGGLAVARHRLGDEIVGQPQPRLGGPRENRTFRGSLHLSNAALPASDGPARLASAGRADACREIVAFR